MTSTIDTRAKFLAVVKALQRRYVTPSMFTSDVSEPYETFKRGDLTDRLRLDQLLSNINLQHDSAADMLQRLREVIGQRIFDGGLFKQLLLSKLPQQVQVVLASFQNNVLDELSASAGRLLEITKSSDAQFFSVKEMPQTTQGDITELCHTPTCCLKFRNDRKRSHTLRRSTSRRRSVSRPRETDNPAGAGIIISIESPPEIAENPAVFPTQHRPTRKTTQGTSKLARVNGNRS
ncbi:unnamed protein product [Schistosoma curassoni]|uniref:Uncharacterized protein n=1 Tax=Schistosoma curassoni TaxID=6186 RepID=A0A183L082_9TREM|nr:unnamed protein product [Schistosoma curassoni]